MDEFVPARVMWFDNEKGYGFARAYGDTEDCYFHWTVLKDAGLQQVDEGMAIAIRVGRSKRGRVAACIRPWDAAIATTKNKVCRARGAAA